ncbi:MAG TPA: MarP family serine protease [Acidimicrobiia bacterium]|nr:MarP family serine protease [Acidimicrobiia bacterium]
MNLLDVAIVAAIVAAAWAGHRIGFTTRALSWAGLAAGIVFAVAFVDDVTRLFRSSPPRTRLLAALGFFLVVCMIGQTVGFVVGSMLRRRLAFTGTLHAADRFLGGVLGGFGVLVALWLLTPALASAPGWTARAVRGSAIVRGVERVAPAPPDSVAALGRLVGDAPFPEVFDRLTSPDAGSPPGSGVPAAVAERVAASVVRVEGQACDEIQQGSGFVAAPGLIVTNAHVVAGERATSVFTSDGRRLDATVVAFDPRADLAVLHAPTALVPALGRATADVDENGAVFGHPRGGSLREAPARIAQEINARGTDIYRTASTERDVFVLAAELQPGDSGGPLVDQKGRVVGVAFAIDPSTDTTAFALTTREVDGVLDPVTRSGTTAPVATGACLVG